jgi:integrase
VGHNVLGQTVRNLCKKAGIDGNFTNHSLRATTVTRGLEKGVPEKLIMARTGHRDRICRC